MSKRIVISGYYGFNNLGDEAVLHSIIQALRMEDPAVEITVLSANPAWTESQYKVKAKDRWKIPQVFSAIKSADLLISGGGSLLQDATSQMSIPYYLGVVAMARTFGKKVAFYAQGIGPIDKSIGQGLTRLIANRVNLITVRDPESAALLKELGVNRPPINVTVDPVVLLKPEIPAKAEYAEITALKNKLRSTGRPLIGIAPRPWKDLVGFKAALSEAANKLKEEQNADILLIPMHHGQDITFCEELSAQIPGALVLRETYTPAELLAVYQELDFLIGIRLHALIFAAAVNVPHLGISYDPKIDAFLHCLDDEPVAAIEDLHSGLLYAEILLRLEGKETEKARIAEKMAQLQAKARTNARMVLDLIN